MAFQAVVFLFFLCHEESTRGFFWAISARNELLAGGVPRIFPMCPSKIQFVAKDLDWRSSTSLSKFGSSIAIDTLWYYTTAMGWQLSSR